jgi:hypothetical protein
VFLEDAPAEASYDTLNAIIVNSLVPALALIVILTFFVLLKRGLQ